MSIARVGCSFGARQGEACLARARFVEVLALRLGLLRLVWLRPVEFWCCFLVRRGALGSGVPWCGKLWYVKSKKGGCLEIEKG